MAKLLDPAQDRFMEADYQTILRQIGRGTVLGISGGRYISRSTGITLPVAYGYSVTVDLALDDTWTVRRVRRQGPKLWLKGEMTGVHAEQLSEVAYHASCYNNGPFGE